MTPLVLQDICGTCRHWSAGLCCNPVSPHAWEAREDHHHCDQWLMRILTMVFTD